MALFIVLHFSPFPLTEGKGFGVEFAERASRPPNAIPMQRNTRTASEPNAQDSV